MWIKCCKRAMFFCLCFALTWGGARSAKAAEAEVETSTTMYVKIDAPKVVVRETASPSGKAVSVAMEGNAYQVMDHSRDGWVKISTPGGSGYIPSNYATMFEKTRAKVDESVLLRQSVVDYALHFVGGKYVYGGTDPHRGADCSGFTSYVMRHVAGIFLSHSSVSQSREGKVIPLSQLRPGDLVFYGGKNYIDHVAIYMGNGKVVHASSVKTGIKISTLGHRPPVKAVSVLN